MLTMSIMLAIGISLTGLFIGKLKRSRAAVDSTVAIYAADSAAERCLYEARSGAQQSLLTLSSGATYVIASGSSDVTNNCSVMSGGSFTFRVTGTYRGVSRALEISQ